MNEQKSTLLVIRNSCDIFVLFVPESCELLSEVFLIEFNLMIFALNAFISAFPSLSNNCFDCLCLPLNPSKESSNVISDFLNLRAKVKTNANSASVPNTNAIDTSK